MLQSVRLELRNGKKLLFAVMISDEVMSLANSIKGQKSFLLASKDGEMFKLDTKEIFYIESVDNKTFIYCKNNIYETKQKLYELEEILKGTKFFRCSKSMILNIGKFRVTVCQQPF